MPAHSATRGTQRASGPWAGFFSSSFGRAHAQVASMEGAKASKSSALVSQTLLDLRQRILDEVKGNKSANSKLRQAHRQRAWEMAFGHPGGDEVEVSTIEISLLCPYSRMALRYPVRSRECQHLQCCDLESWISLLEKCRSMRDPRAPCPVCEKRVAASTLEMDCWQLHVLSQMPSGTHMLILDPDGSYRSGDASRQQKKQQVTEIIESTQAQKEEGDDNFLLNSSNGSASPTQWISDIRIAHVKRERHSEDAPDPPSQGFPSASSGLTQDEDVFAVHYVESVGTTRVLPSQARLWVAHCPRCTRTLLKSEGGEVECCTECGLGREDWTLVRSFPGSSLSLELTRDGTLILRGADALAPHLIRAGFFRAIFADEEDVACPRKDAGIWYTTATLTRYELDFLEACCQRLAFGETLEGMPSVPALFRIPRRRLAPRESAFKQLSHPSLSG
ncbi:hypothetical protein C3747_68g121 [Trypanosoma cruzi]|uniref:SP-RING-type domain-containing protein n=2 Tax=Trypanosoma cruzi TaxID=5693 RepID=Q4DAB5_TRYCC|nr:hypothetical protein, conserved [Trypanosoma cruzi]EAN89467.1 hypothetical protein, conserved [Trypanosoma cruzi]PWV06124.1 hypothetical protein C3747_120g42 [Trypanosoma cruzi]PWV10554.1 hypothetical protein C3747_68g121 [Trypanosoma cruzi]|eukprot:XP_811318.1 hypothetical protein [Trypanosoma cruzi strain CL Brener]